MADKDIERNYVIPLRKAVIKTARWRRAKKAISTIRSFMKRHMKAETVKIGKELNELIWERGGKKVPSKVNVLATKEENIVNVNLVDIQKKKPKEETQKVKKVKEERKETPEDVKPKEETQKVKEIKKETKEAKKSE